MVFVKNCTATIMSRNIVFEGWLTKSPPTKRIWRTKWRRRWFALRQSGELPGQYFLDYYADRNCRRLKGTINLDLCEQVDAGLHMERSGNGTLDPKLRGSVFTIQTQSRTYHLEADCEAEMEQWVDAICRVCGLRATEDSANVLVTYQNNTSLSATNSHYEDADTTGPYIPISECITGVRVQDGENSFPFEQRSVSESRNPLCLNQAQIRLNAEFSENESNVSDDECKSLNASQSNIQVWSVAKTFTKLAVNSKRNGVSENGPPVPPRPPKTFALSKETLQKDTSAHGTKIIEQAEVHVENFYSAQVNPWLRIPRCSSKGGSPSPSSPARLRRSRQVDDDHFHGNLSMQYCNLPTLPPAVDRALKPRHSSHSVGHIHQLTTQSGYHFSHNEEAKTEVLQYLDLDLHPSKPSHAKSNEAHRKKLGVMHGKSLSVVDTDSAYKTVDFLKTEAFNITRQDAEASRSYHH